MSAWRTKSQVEREKSGVNINTEAENGLVAAAGNNDMKTVESLLNGEFPHTKFRALRKACSKGHVQIVERLLQDPDVDPSHNEGVALDDALEEGHAGVVSVLLRHPKVSVEPEALVEASESGFVDCVTILLQQPDINNDIPNKLKALEAAANHGHAQVVDRLLLSRGVKATSELGQAALLQASINGHAEVVDRFLQEAGLDTNEAFKKAQEYGHQEIAVKLREYQNSGFFRKSASACLVM
eukprot:TRINITY_DN5553_c0_g1_i1.p1 TRINITY_DN5553_c0_g1~~TRINITY_DN5553_c0_g1_i1.p1  ORF type:complete len:240 (+),score=87.22 TRINITY_DN5553_c0_g1_i1:78-797(+)